MSVYKFLAEEIRRRQGGPFAYHAADTEFLFRMNDALEPVDASLVRDEEERFPTLWVMGCPRSGTTLLTQLLCGCLDVGYINNIAARFWRAPLVGFRLGRMIGGEPGQADYVSRYAKSASVHAPHEFSYFWHDWFRMEDMPPYDPAAAGKKIDWDGFVRVVRSLAGEARKPFVFKAFDAGYHLKEVGERFPKGIFVYVERAPMEVAVSLARGRLDHYGRLDRWWSNYPVEYEALVDRPPAEQIGGQIAYLRRMYRAGLEAVDPARAVCLTYGELCAAPGAVLEKVRRASRAGCGYELSLRFAPPAAFPRARQALDPETEADLAAALRSFGLDPEEEREWQPSSS